MRTLILTLLLSALALTSQAQNYVGVVPGSDTITENLAAGPGEGA